MSRSILPFYAEDISALVRSLNHQLASCDHSPSHVELLNMLARATGHRNFQHFRSQVVACERLNSPQPPVAPVDYIHLRRISRYFDESSRLVSWPSKFSDQELCLWVFWSRLAPKQVYTEYEISSLLQASHLFGDSALLRRELIDRRMVARTPDCREYRRIEQQPPLEARELIRLMSKRS